MSTEPHQHDPFMADRCDGCAEVKADLDAARAAQDVAGREWGSAYYPATGANEPATPPPDALREALRVVFHDEYERDYEHGGCRHKNQHRSTWDCQERADEVSAALRAQGVVQSRVLSVPAPTLPTLDAEEES